MKQSTNEKLARYCERRAAQYCSGRESHKRVNLALAYCIFAIRLNRSEALGAIKSK